MNETSLPSVIWDREVSSSLPPARGDPVHQLVCWRWEAVLRARVDRRAVAVLNDALGPFALDVVATLDARDVPDGLPVYLEEDGSMTGTRRMNEHLLAAHRVGRIKLASITNMHSYHLARCLRFVRARRLDLGVLHLRD